MSLSPNKPNVDIPPGAPRWVKIMVIIALALIVVFAVLHLTGNSLGGPGSHGMPMEHGLQQP